MFVFDLQRFAYNANLGYDPEVETGEGSETSSAIKVEYTKDGTKTTKYYNNMQAAMDHVYKTCYNSDNSAIPATVTLLKNVTDGAGFVIGKENRQQSDYKNRAINVTLDLNDKTYSFKDALTSVANMTTPKAIQIFSNQNYSNSSVTIKNGTLEIADATSGGYFGRMIKSYLDLTLEDVTIDGTNVKGQAANADGAVVVQSGGGTLTLKGDTNIITQDNYDGKTYYAVGGVFIYDTSWTSIGYTGGFSIAVDTSGYDRDGNEAVLKNIGLVQETGTQDNINANSHKLTIKGKSTIGEINLGSNVATAGLSKAVEIDTEGDDKFTGSIDSFNGTTNLLIYSRDVATSTAWEDATYAIGTAGWNKDVNTSYPDDKYIFVDNTGATSPATGRNVVVVSGVEDESVLKSDGKNLLVPNGATATWSGTLTADSHGDYKLIKATYSGDTDVTINSADANAAIVSNNLLDSDANNPKVRLINASDVNVALSITGNSLDNTIYAGTVSNNLTGGNGADVFVYNGGTDTITDYTVGVNSDKVVLSSDVDAVTDVSKVNASGNNLTLTFDTNKTLTFTNGAATSVVSGKEIIVQSDEGTYLYTKDYIAQDAGVTLTPGYSGTGYNADKNRGFKTIDASYVTGKESFSITGDVNKNYIIASSLGGVLYGATGNDTLKGGNGADTFRYTAGRDVIEDYRSEGNDIVNVQASLITSAKYDRDDNLVFTIDKDRTLAFAPVNDEQVGRIELSDGAGSLSANGVIKDETLSLFKNIKGRISVESGFNNINAEKVTKNTVTLVGGANEGTFTFGSNKRKDLFEFGSNNVTINSYEAGKDKIELGNSLMSGFSVSDKDVLISIGSGDSAKTISLVGAAKDEVLLHDAASKGNSFNKFVFYETGVLHNKKKNQTEATISASARTYNAADSVKKIFAVNSAHDVNIIAGNNKTLIDASEAGEKVTLTGGAKNDKLIGSRYADMFVYTGGKDNITNFVTTGTETTDSISLSNTTKFDIDNAKITLSKKSLKFKFDSKNTLTLKSTDTISTIKIGEDTYTFGKNSVSKESGKVSLTSAFSGTYKVAGGVVDGHLVEKNLTFKGTDAAETLIGGKKKTTFKAGGASTGADSLVGGDGKDIFFYAKGDKGESKIANFEFGVDKLKIANGTVQSITAEGNAIKFEMTSGRKNDDDIIGSFLLESSKGAENINTGNVLIKANNTYYWFAQEGGTGDNDKSYKANDLITASTKVTRTQAISTGYGIIDLGYATNLTKTGVAVKAGEFNFNGGITKRTTT